MPNLKDIRKRVSTVKSTQQITKAMKMVAAAKLRRGQEAAESARPYAEKLGELLQSLSARAGEVSHPFLEEGADAPAHVVLITSDRGLCGGYNATLIRAAETFLASEAGANATMTCCGRRGHDYFKKRIADRIVDAHVNRPGGFDLSLAREVSDSVAERFVAGEVGKVVVVYAQFRSAMSQIPVTEQLLPIAQPEADDSASESVDYLYEPDPATLLQSLLSRYVETRVFQGLLEATASEHGARMTAMDSATRNASEMIDRLTLEMNRARQATITTELMEIVSGAEALNG